MAFRSVALAAATVAAVLASAHAAEARQWWVLDFGQGYCHVINFTPDDFVQAARQNSELSGPPTVNVIRSDYDGSVLGVSVVDTYKTGNQVQMLFATSPGACQGALNYFRSKGEVVNRNELR